MTCGRKPRAGCTNRPAVMPVVSCTSSITAALMRPRKYIDRLVAHTERENADIMATFERPTTPTTSAIPQQAMVGGTVTAFPAKAAR